MADISRDALHGSNRNTVMNKFGWPSGVATLYCSPSRCVADGVPALSSFLHRQRRLNRKISSNNGARAAASGLLPSLYVDGDVAWSARTLLDSLFAKRSQT